MMVKGKEGGRPTTTSRYAAKRGSPMEATHERHDPPVSRCRKCNPTSVGYEHYDDALVGG